MASPHLLPVEPTSPPPLSLESSLQTPSSPLYNLPFTIEFILRQYQAIFKPPHGLPPQHPHEHHIPLLCNTTPINVKLYQYPTLKRYPHC